MRTQRNVKIKKFAASASLAVAAATVVAGFYGTAKLNETMQAAKPDNRPSQKEIPAISITLELLCISVPGDTLFNNLSELKTVDGKDFFTCEEIIAFRNDGGTLEYATGLASMKDLSGKPFFTGYDIVAFKHAGGTVEYAKKFLSTLNSDGRPFSGNQLPQFYILGLEVKDIVTFTDTAKPNALLAYTAHDGELKSLQSRERNYGAFRTGQAIESYHELRKRYDIKTVVASVEDEIYDALDASKGFEFFMVSGHGTETTLSLGENDLRITKAEKDETYTLDTSDWELGWHLQHLNPAAVIFLYSCNTGSGKEKEENLANAVAEWADGRKVVAPTKVLRTGDVQIDNFYPFKATLFYSEENDLSKPVQERKRENITYITGSKF